MEKKINSIVEKFIKESELKDMNEFTFLNRLIDIYDKHFIQTRVYKYKSRIPYKKSFKYSYDFLNSINPEYAEYLKTRALENAFELDYNKENREETAISYLKDGENKIYLPVQNNLDDSYAISHEIIHDMTIDGCENSFTRSLFCETFSLLTEELQYDYFKKNESPSGYRINLLNNLTAIKEKNETIKIEQRLINTYFNKGFINLIDIVDIFKKFKDIDFTLNTLDYIVESNDLSIDFEQRYVIGYLFACYMLDRIKTNPKNIKEFFELNEMINNYELSEFIDYLDLELIDDYDIFDLTEESYNKLEKSYVKRLKEIR